MTNPFQCVMCLEGYGTFDKHRFLEVRPDGTHSDRVYLKILTPEGKQEITVLSDELERAITNAYRAHRRF